jgi:hypothetical protein
LPIPLIKRSFDYKPSQDARKTKAYSRGKIRHLVLFLPMDLILGDRSLIDALFRKEGSAIYTYVI